MTEMIVFIVVSSMLYGLIKTAYEAKYHPEKFES